MMRAGSHEVLVRSKGAAPLLSVVVPVYNMERRGYLRQCIESLGSQKYESAEFVLVDDASIDGSLEMCLEFAAGRSDVTVVRRLFNGRQGGARNSGIIESRGEYIVLVDADDMVSPDYLEGMAEAAMDGSPDCVVPRWRQTVDATGMYVGKPRDGCDDANLLGEIDNEKRRTLIMRHWKFGAYRREIFSDSACLYPEGMAYEDTPTFIVWLSRLNRICQATTGTYYYRIHKGSTVQSTGASNQLLSDRLKSSDMILSNALAVGLSGEEANYYYFRVALMNTLSMLSLRHLRYSSELARHVKTRVQPLDNPYHKQLGSMDRAKEWLACNYPIGYLLLHKCSNLFKS